MASLASVPNQPRYAPISFDLLDEISVEGLGGRSRRDLEDLKADLDDFIAARDSRQVPMSELGTFGLAIMLRSQVSSALS